MVEIACGFCGNQFKIKPSELKRGKKYCSKECASAASSQMLTKEWLEEMISKGLTIDEIADSAKCSSRTVRKYLNRYGISRRKYRPSVKKICPTCKEHFFVRQSRIDDGKGIYCSRECSKEAHQSKVDCICKQCDTLFQRFPSQVTEYCSRRCAGIAKQKIVTLTCEWCHEPFEVNPSKTVNDRRQYCSRKCRYEATSGEGHPNWQDGASFGKYCPKFNNEFKERVREFQGRTCLICSMTEDENGARLSVHHVDDDKEVCCNDRPPMFAAVCRSHNSLAIFDKDRWQRIYHRIIDEIYNGKSYYTKEEFAALA